MPSIQARDSKIDALLCFFRPLSHGEVCLAQFTSTGKIKQMASIFLIQLVGLVLAIAGLIGLTASAHLFGTPLSPTEKRRASDEWNRRRDVYRLPLSLESIAATTFLLGGIGILTWSKFNLCAFLGYWIPTLPPAIRLLLSCQ